MHLLKHYLTIEEKEHLELYSQMIDSKDVESKNLHVPYVTKNLKNINVLM